MEGNTASTLLPIYTVIDSDMSGTFADDLAADGRILLTSAGDYEFKGQVLRDGTMHSAYFYQLASRQHGRITGSSSWFTTTSVMLSTSNQFPSVEGDGDGFINEGADLSVGGNAYVGHRSAGQYCPVVAVTKSTTPLVPITLSSGSQVTTSKTSPTSVPTLRSCHRRAQGSRLRLSHLATAVIILALKLRLLTSPYLAATL